MTTLKVISWSEDGKPMMPAQKRAEIKAFYQKHSGRNIEHVLRVLPRRSTQANRFLWGAVYPICMDAFNEHGNEFTTERVHEFFKLEFRPKQVLGPGGELLRKIPDTTTEMNSEEFSEYIEQIRLFMAETFGVVIPEPGQVIEIHFDKDLNATIVE